MTSSFKLRRSERTKKTEQDQIPAARRRGNRRKVMCPEGSAADMIKLAPSRSGCAGQRHSVGPSHEHAIRLSGGRTDVK